MVLKIVPYKKRDHLPFIKLWAIERGGDGGDDGWYSRLGFVGLSDDCPIVAMFAWRDPSSQRAFIDACSSDPKASRDDVHRLAQGCYRATTTVMKMAGVRWLSTSCTHPFIADFFAHEPGAQFGLAAQLVQINLDK